MKMNFSHPLRLAFMGVPLISGGALAEPVDDFERVETIVGFAIMSSVPAYFLLQAWLAFAWRGRWRAAALLPLIAVSPAVVWSLHALSHDSNLWPITVILLSPFALVYLIVLCAMRTVVRHLDHAPN